MRDGGVWPIVPVCCDSTVASLCICCSPWILPWQRLTVAKGGKIGGGEKGQRDSLSGRALWSNGPGSGLAVGHLVFLGLPSFTCRISSGGNEEGLSVSWGL